MLTTSTFDDIRAFFEGYVITIIIDGIDLMEDFTLICTTFVHQIAASREIMFITPFQVLCRAHDHVLVFDTIPDHGVGCIIIILVIERGEEGCIEYGSECEYDCHFVAKKEVHA